MLKRISVVAAAVAGLAIPSVAETRSNDFTWGASLARQCYLAAASPERWRDHKSCIGAFEQDDLSHYSRVATLVNRGALLMRERQYALALSDFEEAIALNPELGEAYLNSGIAMLGMGAPQDALPMFDRAIALQSSELRQAYYGRGVANELTGNLPQAYLDYEKAAALDPDWALPGDQMRRFSVIRSKGS